MAVVRQSSKQASREIWGAAGGGIAAENTKNPSRLRAPAGGRVSSLSAGIGATLRTLLRRYVQAAPRGGGGGAQHKLAEACLVHYCKLPGGAIMASPLDGPAFRLRQEVVRIVHDEESTTREASDETQQV